MSTQRKVVRLIDCCSDCPNCKFVSKDEYGEEINMYRCTKTGKMIWDCYDTEFPDDCPLEKSPVEPSH